MQKMPPFRHHYPGSSFGRFSGGSCANTCVKFTQPLVSRHDLEFLLVNKSRISSQWEKEAARQRQRRCLFSDAAAVFIATIPFCPLRRFLAALF